MRINIIAAVAENNAIGKENKLLYWLPNDLKRFKTLTTGHTSIFSYCVLTGRSVESMAMCCLARLSIAFCER
jgi:dihydrofolate reductase